MEPIRRILVVDNDPVVRSSVQLLLETRDFDVLSASSVQEARAILSTEPIHLALLDIRLEDDTDPNDTSGLDLAEEMDPVIAKIILTGYASYEHTRRALGPRIDTVPALDVISKKDPPAMWLGAVEQAFHEQLGINTYRQEIVARIMHTIIAGESCSIVGVASTGKSNLFRFIIRPDVRQRYLGEVWSKYLFLYIDTNSLTELSEWGLYELLLRRIIEATESVEIESQWSKLLKDLYQQAVWPEKRPLARGYLEQGVKTLCQQLGFKLVFIFDEFEEIFRQLDTRFFLGLRALRDEHRYRLSYVVATCDELSRIREDIAECEPFYELFSLNTYGLGPYSWADARNMVQRLAARRRVAVTDDEAHLLLEVSGGHPGILRAAFWVLSDRKIDKSGDVFRQLLDNPDIQAECARIWDSIGEDERIALTDVVAGCQLQQLDPGIVRLLLLKGMVKESEAGRAAIFCWLFEEFVNRQEPFNKKTAGITRRFLQKAGFVVKQLSDTSLSASYSAKVGWRRYGDIHILCIEGDVSDSDVSDIASEARGEDTRDGGLAFIVHSGKLVEKAARQLWELKEKRFVVVPIHISTLNELLARSEQVCYASLVSLKDDWSTLSDPYASIDSSDPQWFVGRKQRIRSALDSIDQSKAVGIFGTRRIGKTLLLNQLHTACYQKGYPVTMLTCTPESSLSALLYGVIEGLAHCAKSLYPQLVLPELDTTTSQGVADVAVRFRTDLTKLEEAVSRAGAYGMKLVVLLDEIDHIVPTEGSTEQDYRRYVEFFQAIKGVAESSDFLSVVAAGYSPAALNRTDRFPAQPQFENPMYDRFNEIRLPLMVKEESDEIVQNFGALAGLEYVEESLQGIYEEANGHPEITRKLCSCVLAEQIERGEQPGIVTPDTVDSAVRRFLSDPRYTFYLNGTYWESSLMVNADLKKLILFALAKASCSKEQIVSQAADWLTAFLLYEDAVEEIEIALVSLEEIGLVSHENGEYRIGIHLLLRWIRQEKLKEDPFAPAGGG